ncbi:hypothetical protein [Paraurantiacibacter namhicola]|uniref:Uncharacterized protein n=1 Tax=Paraurantiacibacter namhicola TaxID=645517 RepID=A0A1C7D558_9SPHN|nr:hypothetical protein [Paraurantiacibacter namhicola]ANU06595.1 hypothetical protein A6F65_00268 [Paraurantiacibacter namhicola]
MLQAKTRDGALASQLAAKARQMARAHTANRLLSRRADPLRWRKPGLLWPHF